MTETNPVPWLRSGTGQTPADGGCIMQVVDWIDRGEWTDRPPCVHPVIQRLAISVNDSLDDADRQRLLDLAPRMMNTASDDKRLAVQLAVFCAERVLPISNGRARKQIESAREWLRSGKRPAYAAAAAAAYAYAAADAIAAAYAAAAAADYAAAAAYAAADYAAIAAAAAYAADAIAIAAAAAAAANAAIAAAAAIAADAAGNARLDLLVAVLDEYDRLTDRTATNEPLDYAPVCAAMAGQA